METGLLKLINLNIFWYKKLFRILPSCHTWSLSLRVDKFPITQSRQISNNTNTINLNIFTNKNYDSFVFCNYSAGYYIKVMKKVQEKGDEYITTESQRLERMMSEYNHVLWMFVYYCSVFIL